MSKTLSPLLLSLRLELRRQMGMGVQRTRLRLLGNRRQRVEKESKMQWLTMMRIMMTTGASLRLPRGRVEGAEEVQRQREDGGRKLQVLMTCSQFHKR